jgi:hypothetical protein
MLTNRTYVDDMDKSRTVRPVSVVGNQVSCRVFYDGRPAGGAVLPLSLFRDNPLPEDPRKEKRIYLRLES